LDLPRFKVEAAQQTVNPIFSGERIGIIDPAKYEIDSQVIENFKATNPDPVKAIELTIESNMPEDGVIFSDGIQSDFLEFNSGTIATISIADKKANLVINNLNW